MAKLLLIPVGVDFILCFRYSLKSPIGLCADLRAMGGVMKLIVHELIVKIAALGIFLTTALLIPTKQQNPYFRELGGWEADLLNSALLRFTHYISLNTYTLNVTSSLTAAKYYDFKWQQLLYLTSESSILPAILN